jgi:membrane-associated phospholipid phosphatase
MHFVQWRSACVGSVLLITTVQGQRLDPAPPLVRRADVLRTGAWVAATAVAFPLDARIDRWSARRSVQEHRALRGLARVGDATGSYVSLGLGPALWAVGAARGDSGLRVMGQRTTAAVGVAFVTTGAIKVLAGRARPVATNNAPSDWNMLRGLRTDSLRSFSSAHSALSTAAAITLAAEWRRQGLRGWRTAGPPLVYALAGIAGGSRIRDRQHWASDVMMGAAVGTASALVTRRWLDRREARRP